MKLLTLFVIGLLFGFAMVVLLPAILGVYLTDWWASLVGTPVRCDAGAEGDHSPTAFERVEETLDKVIERLTK